MVIEWDSKYIDIPNSTGKIGKFVDTLIEKFPERIQLQPDGETIYLPLEDNEAKALSVDSDGNMIWTKLEAVTRHPPINKDGSSTLVKITTKTGKTLIATKAKSFLVGEKKSEKWTVVDKDGDKISLGDKIPIVKNYAVDKIKKTIKMCEYLNEQNFMFTDNIIKAKTILENENLDKNWFIEIRNKVTQTRPIHLKKFVKSGIDADKNHKLKTMFEPGLVLPKKWASGSFSVTKFPSEIILDEDFGFLVGAYIAEGSVSVKGIQITNTNDEYKNKVMMWPSKMGIRSKKYKNKKSEGVEINSVVISTLFEKMCGKLSYGKFIPSYAYTAPKEFVLGLLDAVFCGDGWVNECGSVGLDVRSKEFRDGITLLLNRFDIVCSHRVKNEKNKKDKNDPDGELKPMWRLYVSTNEVSKLQEIVKTLKYKNDRLINKIHDNEELIKDKHFECECGKKYKIKKSLKRHKNESCKLDYTQNNVFFDEVVKIEDFTSEHPFVYDLTVEKTRNMVTTAGVNCKDTFHTSGSSAKNVTMGVPRFTELIDVSKHMKTPSVSIRLDDSMKPSEVMAKMEHTTLRKVIHKFVREPLPELFQFVAEYDEETGEPIPLPTYRCIELNSELCIAKGITMQEIANHMKDKVSVLHTSENSERWLMWFPKGSSIPLDMHLKGVEHIEKIVMRQELDTDDWIMDTDGTNLIEVLSHPGVDWIKTTCNNVVETTEILGIEAGRELLLQEIRNVISVDGTYVNYRHIAILVDAMTYRGELTPMSRHGINRVTDASVFHRASFEKTVNELSNAGLYAERDPLKSITASILMGKLSDSGTGFVDVIPDEPEFKFEDGESDDISVSGFEVGSEIPESFDPESFEPETFDLKGFEVPDYDELYAEIEKPAYKYVPSSPKVVFKTLFNYVPSSPKISFGRKAGYIPSSP